jgi:hypothetical protein
MSAVSRRDREVSVVHPALARGQKVGDLQRALTEPADG